MRLAAVLDAPRTAAAEPSPAEGFASIPGVPVAANAILRHSCAHARHWHLVQVLFALSARSAVSQTVFGLTLPSPVPDRGPPISLA